MANMNWTGSSSLPWDVAQRYGSNRIECHYTPNPMQEFMTQVDHVLNTDPRQLNILIGNITHLVYIVKKYVYIPSWMSIFMTSLLQRCLEVPPYQKPVILRAWVEIQNDPVVLSQQHETDTGNLIDQFKTIYIDTFYKLRSEQYCGMLEIRNDLRIGFPHANLCDLDYELYNSPYIRQIIESHPKLQPDYYHKNFYTPDSGKIWRTDVQVQRTSGKVQTTDVQVQITNSQVQKTNGYDPQNQVSESRSQQEILTGKTQIPDRVNMGVRKIVDSKIPDSAQNVAPKTRDLPIPDRVKIDVPKIIDLTFPDKVQMDVPKRRCLENPETDQISIPKRRCLDNHERTQICVPTKKDSTIPSTVIENHQGPSQLVVQTDQTKMPNYLGTRRANRELKVEAKLLYYVNGQDIVAQRKSMDNIVSIVRSFSTTPQCKFKFINYLVGDLIVDTELHLCVGTFAGRLLFWAVCNVLNDTHFPHTKNDVIQSCLDLLVLQNSFISIISKLLKTKRKYHDKHKDEFVAIRQHLEQGIHSNLYLIDNHVSKTFTNWNWNWLLINNPVSYRKDFLYPKVRTLKNNNSKTGTTQEDSNLALLLSHGKNQKNKQDAAVDDVLKPCRNESSTRKKSESILKNKNSKTGSIPDPNLITIQSYEDHHKVIKTSHRRKNTREPGIRLELWYDGGTSDDDFDDYERDAKRKNEQNEMTSSDGEFDEDRTSDEEEFAYFRKTCPEDIIIVGQYSHSNQVNASRMEEPISHRPDALKPKNKRKQVTPKLDEVELFKPDETVKKITKPARPSKTTKTSLATLDKVISSTPSNLPVKVKAYRHERDIFKPDDAVKQIAVTSIPSKPTKNSQSTKTKGGSWDSILPSYHNEQPELLNQQIATNKDDNSCKDPNISKIKRKLRQLKDGINLSKHEKLRRKLSLDSASLPSIAISALISETEGTIHYLNEDSTPAEYIKYICSPLFKSSSLENVLEKYQIKVVHHPVSGPSDS